MKITKEQISELAAIAASEKPGKVVDLRCFGVAGALDTRANRNERILPDVNYLVVLGEDGKFSPLTEEEKTEITMAIFNDFWIRHLNFAGNHFEFIDLQNDFFTGETYSRMTDYAKVFFENRVNAEKAGRNKFKYKLDPKTEINRLMQFEKAFNPSVARKMKEVSKSFSRRKKEQRGKDISVLQELIANNLAWQDEQKIDAGATHELRF